MSNETKPAVKKMPFSKLITIIVTVIALFIAFVMWGWPQYKVYSARLSGEAILAEAISAKQAAVETARAKLESAELLAQADEKRAVGVRNSISIIEEKLNQNSAYLQYLWITEIAANDKGLNTIYLPSNGGIPLLEAGRTIDLEKKLKEQMRPQSN